VTLGVQPDFADTKNNEYIAAVGERVDLDCSLKPNVYPPVMVLWQKIEGSDLKILGKGENYTMYTIEKAESNDSGIYVCKVTNDPRKPSAEKDMVLNVYVRAECNFSSAEKDASNVSVTVKVSGRPQPRFSAVDPWHHLTSHTNGLHIVTRHGNFSDTSPQVVGSLSQVITSGGTKKTFFQLCNASIASPLLRPQICIFIRFTPNAMFCRRKSKAPFNGQVCTVRRVCDYAYMACSVIRQKTY
jgi:hypothetical protein